MKKGLVLLLFSFAQITVRSKWDHYCGRENIAFANYQKKTSITYRLNMHLRRYFLINLTLNHFTW